MSKKRILIFTEEYFKATTGMFTVVENLFENVQSMNFDVTLCTNYEHWHTRSDVTRLAKISTAEGVRSATKKLRQKYFILKLIIFCLTSVLYVIDKVMYFVYLLYFLRSGKYDLLNVHNGGWPGGWVSRVIILSAKFAGVEVCYSLHNVPQNLITIHKGYFREIFKFYSKFISYYIYPSNFLKQAFSHYDGASKSVVIYNSIECSHEKRFSRVNECTQLRIGFVGSLSHLKMPDDVINLVKNLESGSRDCKVVHFGYIDDSYLKKHGLSLDDLRAMGSYDFRGFFESRNLIYSSFDVLLAPSRLNESFGLVVIEALAHGIPVICYNGCAFPEIVDKGRNGYLYDDFGDLLNVIDTYLGSPELLTVHGNGALATCKEKFGRPDFINKYLEIFRVSGC